MKNVFIALIVSTQVFAGMVEFSGTPKSISASGQTIKVYPDAVIKAGEHNLNTKLSGFGIRKKPVLFTKVNVYVAASYMDDLSQVKVEQPFESIKNTKARVMQLTFLRSLSGAEIRASMEEALILNNVDVSSEAFQALFNQFTFDLNPGQTLTVITYNKGGNLENVTIEVPATRFSAEGNFLGLDLWKGWFGAPVDDGMKALQPELLTIK